MISAAVIEEINRLSSKNESQTSKTSEYVRQCVRSSTDQVVDGDEKSSKCVEELWSIGKKLEWKRSGRLLMSFTGEGDVLQAIWANFLPNLTCIVIRESERLRIYAESGEEFLVPLPFPLKKIWNTGHGLILERESDLSLSPSNPSLLVLHHPLDDLTRIVVHQKSGLPSIEWTTDRHKIIMTSKDPSICLTYDSELGHHCIWNIRQTDQEDLNNLELDQIYEQAQTPQNGTPSFCTGPPGTLGGRSQGGTTNPSHAQQTSFQASSGPSSAQATPQNSLTKSSIFSGRPTPQQTPAQSANATPVLMMSSSAIHSPLTSLAAISRSPSTSTMHNYLPSRLASHAGTPIHSQSFNGYHTRDEPLPPDFTLCFEPLWSDHSSPHSPKADKAFLSSDALGQKYLCYLFSSKEVIRCVRYMTSDEGLLTFGTTFQINGVDGASIDSLGMVLTLDPGRQTLTLHSGNVKVSRVYFHPSPNIQMANIAHEIAGLRLDASSQHTPWSSNVVRQIENESGVEVMTSSRPPSAVDPMFNESLNLSPVRAGDGDDKPQIESLDPDVSASQVMLHYDNGVSLRLGLSALATSPLVRHCLKALRIYLPRDASLHFICQWYSCRNTIGSENLSPSQEWEQFVKCLLKQCGYHIDTLNVFEFSMRVSGGCSPEAGSKKVRPNEHGSDDDWQLLLTSAHHREAGAQISYLLGLKPVSLGSVDDSSKLDVGEPASTDRSSPLFNQLYSVTWALHLLYEEIKLDKSLWDLVPMLAKLLSLLSGDLCLRQYVYHYWRDFPEICPANLDQAKTGQLAEIHLTGLNAPMGMRETSPPNIHQYLKNIVDGSVNYSPPFPILRDVSRRSQDLIICYVLLTRKDKKEEWKLEQYLKPVCGKSKRDHLFWNSCFGASSNSAEDMIEYLVTKGYDQWKISTIPSCLALPIYIAIYESRLAPPTGWKKEAYLLIGRKDFALGSEKMVLSIDDDEIKGDKNKTSLTLEGQTTSSGETPKKEEDSEKVESELTKLRWPKDRRVSEVFRLLQSSRPIILNMQQRPEMNNHDFQVEREKSLRYYHVRRLALPVGRGAMVLQTATTVPTEPINIPLLQLKGSSMPLGHLVSFEYTDSVPYFDKWPYFHNGVAAGLRLSASSAEDIDSSWIMFNKQNAGDMRDKPQEGGFLMALGLTGHLSKLGKLESFDYLIRGDENINTGLVLGMAAAKIGSMDVLVTKKISTQLEALLPATGTELPLSHTTQVASLIALGLLYIESGHRHMAEVCLTELSRTPGPESESSIDRESYSLSAGLALGMITLGQGDELLSGPLSGSNLAETLYYHMVGGPRPSEGGRPKFRSPSYQIQEGESINIDVTSPGATLALGLMFLRSGNQRIASWMNAPESQFLLKFVRPDFLMLRTLAKGLILWDDICPTRDWIDSHVPSSIRRYCMVRPEDSPLTSNIDYETINQAYCHIITGAALAMAIRFAGSGNAQAFEVLHQMTLSLHVISKRSVAELAGQATVEQTLCILVLSLGIVMAGTGDLEVVRLIRFLGSRVGPKFPTVTYGSHMALHMAMGLLFLGGGRFNLSTEPRAVAVMVCAFFPKFPTHSLDNRYHLQALRHLYVLAAEPRLLVPRDIESKELVSCHVEVELCDTIWYKGRTLVMTAPVMLPELKYLKRVTIQDSRYHQITFSSDCESWNQLKRLLSVSGIVHIKQKAGCLSYKDDPQGFRSLTGQCLAKDTAFHWSLSVPQLLSTFASDPNVSYFSSNFIRPVGRNRSAPKSIGNAAHIEQTLGSLLYECASHEKLDVLPFWMSIFHLLWHWERDGSHHFAGDQISVLLSLASRTPNRLICPEIVASISQECKRRFDAAIKANGKEEISQFLSGNRDQGCGIQSGKFSNQSLSKILSSESLTSSPLQNMDTEKLDNNPLRWLAKTHVSGKTIHSFLKLRPSQ